MGEHHETSIWSEIARRVRPFLLYACVFSLASNLLLLAPSIYLLQVFDRVLTSRSHETLVMLSILALTALCAMALLDARRAGLLVGAAIVAERIIAPRVLSIMLSEAAQPNSVENIHAFRDVTTLRAFLSGPGVIALFDLPWLPIYVAIVFLFHPVLGIVASIGTLALAAIAWLNEKLSRKPVEQLQLESRRNARFADLALRNAEVVGALGMLPALRNAWVRRSRAVFQLQLESGRVQGLFASSTKFARQAIQLAMLGTGAYLVIDLHTTGGVMMATTVLLGRALAPVESIVSAWKGLVEARSAYRRLRRMLSGEAQPRHVTQLPCPRGELCVDKLVFGIADRVVIKGVSFELNAGDSLAIIGPSASGKSTLARLLLGIWHPSSGIVRLDGADVAGWPREALAPHVGYLPQDVELFAATVSENIARMGEVDDGAVIEAAQRAGVHELILSLPQGYDTQIGEAGCFLSGGQRQRLGLARALYGKPRLIVLDEPSANLDTEGEAALLQAMAEIKSAGTTLIVITHRPSMIGLIDSMLVLRDGRVELFGPRAAVMARVSPGIAPVKTPAVPEPVRLHSQS